MGFATRPLVAACLLAGFVSGAVHAQSATPPARYSTTDTPIGTLLDNPASKAVIQKYAPRVVGSPQIDAVRDRSLKALQGYAPQELSDEVLGKMDAELIRIAPK